jgi:predicted GNAT family N-acyltransferase
MNLINLAQRFLIENETSDLIKILEKNLEEKYPIDLSIYYSNHSDAIILSKIIVDPSNRNSGIGSKVMDEICEFSDLHKLRIALTPSSDFGGSKSRLVKFYKSFGFVNYKGFEFRESMVRNPK